MKKTVNIEPSLPITTIVPAIYNPVFNCNMSIGDILNCICAKAKVTEVLKDGSLIKLDFSNYDKVHETEIEENVEIDLSDKEEIVTPINIDRELEETSEILPEENEIEENNEFDGLSEEEIKEYKELLEMEFEEEHE